jgi:hypothetical protein
MEQSYDIGGVVLVALIAIPLIYMRWKNNRKKNKYRRRLYDGR